MFNLANNINAENLTAVMQNSKWKAVMEKCEHYKVRMRAGEKGKTAAFWVRYMDKAWLLLQFLRATEANDIMLHMRCLHEMCPLFFSQEK